MAYLWTDKRGRQHRSSLNAAERAVWAQDRTDRLKLLFDTNNKNPVFAWDAYLVASDLDVPIPTWLLDHFDSVAGNLVRLRHLRQPKEREIAPSITEAFGFAPGGAELQEANYYADSGLPFREKHGAFNPLHLDVARDLEIAEAVAG